MIAPATAATNTVSTNSVQVKQKGLLSKINLTATQKAQVKSIRDTYRDQGKDGHKQARAEIAKVLTAQQRSQLDALKSERKAG
ncbi:hypothetical protein [Psychrobacter sp. SWN149]|uniref:hypothetical protein n=1 Tax=Psychrobacter sp. SWN149 TaxID=2792057 RepID=UPI0018CD7E05|nr:hypothetical protein [Psychrobacter sp. SWN149]MBH0007103.1 hypothetical protein [Psychrobacter sp. SWN149]